MQLFQQMQQEGISPGKFRCAHEQVIQSGCESKILVGASLVDIYAKCGSIEDAWRVFNKMPS